MRKTYLLPIISLFLIPFGAAAQAVPCVVVTASFDTLTGIFVKSDDKLVFKQAYKKHRTALLPEEIYEYKLLQSDGTSISYQYIMHPKTGKRVPMRRLIEGYYKLYLHKESVLSSVNPALPKNSSVPRLASVYYLASYSEDAVEVSPRNWKQVLYKRLVDCPPLLESIAEKNFQFKQLPAIIASYNAFVRQDAVNQKKADAPILEK